MEILTKAELYRQMDRYFADKDRTLSLAMFAELAGISESLIKRVFQIKDMPMTEHTQIAVSRALERMTRGDVVMVYNKDKTRFLQYRQVPRPRMGRGVELTVSDGQVRLKPGIRNKSDYSSPSFAEQLKK